MEAHLETIRTALLSDATNDQRHQGVLACRAILTVLGATDEPAAPTAPPVAAPLDVASIVGAMRTLGPDQLLEIAITKLRAAVPDFDGGPRQLSPVRFHLVPVPPVKR